MMILIVQNTLKIQLSRKGLLASFTVHNFNGGLEVNQPQNGLIGGKFQMTIHMSKLT